VRVGVLCVEYCRCRQWVAAGSDAVLVRVR
jgi:hypothetical protein